MTPHSSHERLQAIGAALGGIKRYLEIGVAKGSTFFEIEADEKHGVDPRFRFDTVSRKKYKNEIYHSTTSNTFFSQKIGLDAPFDLIFLDGLHTYNQTLRDFLASQALAHLQTVWLIDDTVPTDPISADPDLDRVRTARVAQGQADDETWMGDVFKVIVFIDSFCPQYTCLTLEGHGQTIILPKPKHTSHEIIKKVEDIDKMSYVDVLLLKETLLKPIDFQSILMEINEIARTN